MHDDFLVSISKEFLKSLKKTGQKKTFKSQLHLGIINNKRGVMGNLWEEKEKQDVLLIIVHTYTLK